MEAGQFLEKIDFSRFERWKQVGNFIVLNPEFATGDCSKIYVCETPDGSKKLAIKTYTNQWILDNEQIVQSETQAMLDLKATNIVPLLEYDLPLQTSNNIYIPMQLSNCGSLDLPLKAGKKYPMALLREVGTFLGNALNQLHTRKMIHRSVNPRHILANMDSTGKVTFKLIGLQFCKTLTKGTANSLVGTIAYNAPEAAGGNDYSFPADIWSVGVTLYELATGMLPTHVNKRSVAQIKAGFTPVFPEPVGSAFKHLITNCLLYDPKARLTALQLLQHPFILGQDAMPFAEHLPEKEVSEDVKHKETKEAKVTKAELLTKAELMTMIQDDFAKYMEYMINISDKHDKLKVEKRTSLGQYQLLSSQPLSRGGFSEIFRCRDTKTNVEYALKVINTKKMRDVKIANLLMGEVEVMLDISSSRFSIAIHEYFVMNNLLHLVLEYCNGGDLDKYIREITRSPQKTISAEEFGLIAFNVASGLRDMHAHGIMHRDIKAKNILLMKDKNGKLCDVRLCDYGLSKRVEKGNEIEGTTVLGTYDYFAPEMYQRMKQQLAGITPTFKYNERVDVWAYGILLYFVAAGKTPHEAPGSQHKVMEEHTIVSFSNSAVPPGYLSVMQKCLNYDHLTRPSFDQVLQDPYFDTFKARAAKS